MCCFLSEISYREFVGVLDFVISTLSVLVSLKSALTFFVLLYGCACIFEVIL